MLKLIYTWFVGKNLEIFEIRIKSAIQRNHFSRFLKLKTKVCQRIAKDIKLSQIGSLFFTFPAYQHKINKAKTHFASIWHFHELYSIEM